MVEIDEAISVVQALKLDATDDDYEEHEEYEEHDEHDETGDGEKHIDAAEAERILRGVGDKLFRCVPGFVFENLHVRRENAYA